MHFAASFFTLTFLFLSSLDAEYDVEFKTSSQENAGTDANVFFQMIGEDGESDEIKLENTGKGYFHNGQLDRFRVQAKDVGKVSKNSFKRNFCYPALRKGNWFLVDEFFIIANYDQKKKQKKNKNPENLIF